MKRMFRMKPTKYEKATFQLNDLIRDRESFLKGDAEYDAVFKEDIKALKTAIRILEKADYKRTNLQLHFVYGIFSGALTATLAAVTAHLLAYLII